MEDTARRDQRVMSIVVNAMRVPSGERREFVRAACKGDEELFAEITEEIAWEERMGDFLSQPLFDFQDVNSPFHAGDVVLDRFEIVREAGAGGMGIVYEAFDRKRNKRVALKVGKRSFRRLLSPELEGALKVRHPNICLVNEIHTAKVNGTEVDFLTMEYLDGESLASRLRQGPLDTDTAYAIAGQLCKGLAEAHRVGVIHRDLKAANIFIVPEGDAVRAVITDFGLAASATDGAPLAGSPPYMAPELWRGEKATTASDVFALGVVLYEMVTGQRPLDEIPLPERFEARPAPPSRLAPKLPGRWDDIILQCLDPDPTNRPTDAAAVLNKLEPPKRHRLRTAALAIVAISLLAAAIPPVRETVIAEFAAPDVRLAMLAPDAPADLAIQAAGIVQDVGERLKRQQRRRATLVVISAADAQHNNVSTPEQAKNVLQATHAFQVKLRRVGTLVEVEGDIVELETLTHLRDFAATYPPSDFAAAPAALTGTVSTALHLRGTTHFDDLSPRATPAYEQGLFLLHRDFYSFASAAEKFLEASQLDSRSALPFAGLVEADLGMFDLAKDPLLLERAKDALRHAESLNPDSVAVRLASGLLNYTTGEYARALNDYLRVRELEPRNVDVMLRIARVYDAQNLPERAVESYRTAINLDPNYYAAYHSFGGFYYYRGDYAAAAEQFKRTIEHAPGLYEAYTNLGAVLDDMGRDSEAEEALRKSLELHETPRALNSIGAVLAYQGRDEEALKYYLRATEKEPGNYKYQSNAGDSARRLHRRELSLAAYRRGASLAVTELKANPHSAITRAFVAYLEARLGHSSRAADEIDQALTMAPDDSQVLRCAVLTYDALGDRSRVLQSLRTARPEMLRELNRHPDLADLHQDPRFIELIANITHGGS